MARLACDIAHGACSFDGQAANANGKKKTRHLRRVRGLVILTGSLFGQEPVGVNERYL
jgi:hypothetical protein